jgi:hypothetical protein
MYSDLALTALFLCVRRFCSCLRCAAHWRLKKKKMICDGALYAACVCISCVRDCVCMCVCVWVL